MKLDDVILGKKYKDMPTGFEGVATCKFEMLEGEPRIGLERATPLHFDERHFNVDRLEPVERSIFEDVDAECTTLVQRLQRKLDKAASEKLPFATVTASDLDAAIRDLKAMDKRLDMIGAWWSRIVIGADQPDVRKMATEAHTKISELLDEAN